MSVTFPLAGYRVFIDSSRFAYFAQNRSFVQTSRSLTRGAACSSRRLAAFTHRREAPKIGTLRQFFALRKLCSRKARINAASLREGGCRRDIKQKTRISLPRRQEGVRVYKKEFARKKSCTLYALACRYRRPRRYVRKRSRAHIPSSYRFIPFSLSYSLAI